MKQTIFVIASLCLALLLTACGGDSILGAWVPSENSAPSAEGIVALEFTDNEDALDTFTAGGTLSTAYTY